MDYSFTDLGAEGCRRSLNALFCPQLIRNLRTRRRIDCFSIIAHPVNFDIPWERSLKISYQELDIYWYYQYKQFDNWYGFSISIGNTICDPEAEDTVYWPGWLNISSFLLTRLVRSSIKPSWHVSLRQVRCDMAFIGPMHRNKPNITSFLPKK